jgi:DNA polymerase III subunit beta
MKIKINKDALNRNLLFLQTGIPSKVVVPVEGWVLFEIEGEDCFISICNARVHMESYVKVESDADCRFCLPAHMIARTVANFPDGDVVIKPVINKELDIIAAIELKPEGQKKKYKISCNNVSEFAIWDFEEGDPDKELTIGMDILNDRLKVAGHNVDASEIREAFSNIVFYSFNDKLTIVSGNSHCIVTMPIDLPFEDTVIIPREFSKYTSMFTEAGDCKISFTNRQIYLEFGSNKIASRLIDGQAPNYGQLIEAVNKEEVELNRNDLIDSIKRLAIFSADTRKVKLFYEKSELTLRAADEKNEAEEVISTIKESNIEFQTTLNYTFLQDSLVNIKCDTVRLITKGGMSMVYVKPSINEDQLWIMAPHAS